MIPQVEVYRVWADNSTSYHSTLDVVTAKQYTKLMGGKFKLVPVKVGKAIKGKKAA